MDQTPWQIAQKRYVLSDVFDMLQSAKNGNRAAIPEDVYSHEFAEWLTEQLRLALAQGIHEGRYYV